MTLSFVIVGLARFVQVTRQERARLYGICVIKIFISIRLTCLTQTISPELSLFKDTLGPALLPFVGFVLGIHKTDESFSTSAHIQRAASFEPAQATFSGSLNTCVQPDRTCITVFPNPS